MGVHGLWKLIDKAGRPIPVETLENKVLAVDVSIWLYQLVRGFDSSARPGSSAFLLGLFHRICKLLFYRIKPVFVFDGGVPSLKKKTIVARQKGRRKAGESFEKVRQQLLENLIKQQALGDVLGEKVKIPKQFSSRQDELFWLPKRDEISQEDLNEIKEESESDDEPVAKKYFGDLNSVDIESEEFLKLPADVRHDILTDLKETRKLNSWARIHLMPEEANDFSSYQMGRLLKRRAVQAGLEKAEQELGTRGLTIHDLTNLLTEQGIDLSQRIASNDSTRFIYASNPASLSQETGRADLSEDEDDPSELVRPTRSHLSESSSESENEILQSIGKISKSETGGLSQKEILELIKQQSGKVGLRENQSFDRIGASTSKQSDSPATMEERSSSASKIIASDELNDHDVPRGKSIFPNNNLPEVEPGKLPGPPSTGSPASSPLQKDSPLYTNQPEGVSPSKNSSCDVDSSLVTDNKISSCNQEKNPYRSESQESEGDESISDDLDKSKLGTESNEQMEKELLAREFKDDPDIMEEELELLQAIQKAVTQCIDTHADKLGNKVGSRIHPKADSNRNVSHTNVDNTKSLTESSGAMDNPKIVNSPTALDNREDIEVKKSLEIVIDPNAHPDDDLFADVFSQSSPGVATDSEMLSADHLLPERIDGSAMDVCVEQKSSVVQLSPSAEMKSKGIGANSDGKSLEIAVDPLDDDDNPFADVEHIEKEMSPAKAENPNFWKLVNEMKKTSSTTDLDSMMHQLEQESEKLASDTKREERLTSTITEQITQDAQVLLQLFGIPYVVAPMEAEAQCAYLDLTEQTEGTITEDSDIWLFGARNVYKNFFDQKKFVKQFKATDIHQCYRLNRDDLIMIAMLVGSDYTTGLAGVGPVNAIEIVAHFPQASGASTPQQRLAKFVDAYLTSEMNQQLMRKLKSLEFFDGFPSDDVVKAYISPIVDESREKFTWSKPNLVEIRNFMREKFGWDTRKTDQTLKPILDRWTQTTTQRTIHNYFEWAFDVEEVSAVSKRVGKAVEILTTGEIPNSPPPSKKPRNAEPKDRLQSNYSRRKYGRYQVSNEVDTEPVLEGSRAARAAAKAIMAATRKPKPKLTETTSIESEAPASSLSMPAVTRANRRTNPQASSSSQQKSDANVTTAAPQTERIRQSRQSVDAGPSTSGATPIPSLSDILCGVGSEPSPWTPAKDFVSPYVKRKYGRMGQHSTYKKDESRPALPRLSEDLGRIMPSKTPAQIARERAAKKLKEAKAKALQKSKTKKAA